MTIAALGSVGNKEPCALCLMHRPLRDSHLLPAALYRLARDASDRNPNPVIVTKAVASQRSAQISQYLLCGTCEDRFSRHGERHVLKNCARPSGFRLLDALTAAPALCEGSSWRVVDISGQSAVAGDHYLYFAASVFWRAAVASWNVNGRRIPSLSLGAGYQEQFRKYLLDGAPFPALARMFVHAWTDAVDSTSIAPTSSRVGGVYRHKFCIPGVGFTLFVGRSVPSRQNAGALNSTEGQFMWTSSSRSEPLLKGFAKQIRSARALSA